MRPAAGCFEKSAASLFWPQVAARQVRPPYFPELGRVCISSVGIVGRSRVLCFCSSIIFYPFCVSFLEDFFYFGFVDLRLVILISWLFGRFVMDLINFSVSLEVHISGLLLHFGFGILGQVFQVSVLLFSLQSFGDLLKCVAVMKIIICCFSHLEYLLPCCSFSSFI